MEKDKLEQLFAMLVKLMAARGGDAQQKINDWVRDGSGCNMLPLFNSSADISDDHKAAVYKHLVAALVSAKWEEDLPKALAKPYADVVGSEAPKPEPVPVPEEPKQEPKKRKTPKSEDAPPPAGDADAALKVLKQLLGGGDMSQMAGVAATAAKVEVDRWVKEDLQGEMERRMKDGAFPVERVQKMIDDRMDGLILRVAIQLPDGSSKEMNRQHYKFPLLLAALNCGCNVAMVGPAGSGKSEAARLVAEALNAAFEAMSVGPQTSKADLFGFRDANGNFHETPFLRRYRDGGIMLLDEMDAANAGVLTYTNMGLSNSAIGTANGMIEKHDGFRMVAGLNTFGMGANRIYVGRNQLDGATMDRFVVIDWPHDEGLEAHIVGVEGRSPKLKLDDGGVMDPGDWVDYVQKVRKEVDAMKVRHVVSPRATIYGTRLFAAGVGRKHVEDMVLWKGMDENTRAKIVQKVGA